jgi:hypothetical protein
MNQSSLVTPTPVKIKQQKGRKEKQISSLSPFLLFRLWTMMQPLLVMQRFDGIEAGSPGRGIEAEDQADRHRDEEGEHD